jgi:hypothetical protein
VQLSTGHCLPCCSPEHVPASLCLMRVSPAPLQAHHPPHRHLCRPGCRLVPVSPGGWLGAWVGGYTALSIRRTTCHQGDATVLVWQLVRTLLVGVKEEGLGSTAQGVTFRTHATLIDVSPDVSISNILSFAACMLNSMLCSTRWAASLSPSEHLFIPSSGPPNGFTTT